jgi:hypothetical protein
MTALKCLTGAAAILVLSISAAVACDDYAEEMAVAEAMKASQQAQTADAQQAHGTQTAAPASVATEPTSVAAIAAKPAADTPAGVVRQ